MVVVAEGALVAVGCAGAATAAFFVSRGWQASASRRVVRRRSGVFIGFDSNGVAIDTAIIEVDQQFVTGDRKFIAVNGQFVTVDKMIVELNNQFITSDKYLVTVDSELVTRD